MNTEMNSTMADITTMGATAERFDASKLPEVAYFRVQSRGAVGTYKKGLGNRAVGAWALLVSCKDGKGLRLATDVAYEFGMKLKGEFKEREEAIEAGKKAISAWGKAVEKKAPKAKGPTKKDMAAEIEAQKAEIEKLRHQLALKAA